MSKNKNKNKREVACGCFGCLDADQGLIPADRVRGHFACVSVAADTAKAIMSNGGPSFEGHRWVGYV